MRRSLTFPVDRVECLFAYRRTNAAGQLHICRHIWTSKFSETSRTQKKRWLLINGDTQQIRLPQFSFRTMTEDAHQGSKPGRKNHGDSKPPTEAYTDMSNDGVGHKSSLSFNQNPNAHLASQESRQSEERKHSGPTQAGSQSTPGKCFCLCLDSYFKHEFGRISSRSIMPCTCCTPAS
jgi:hypothetical protein